MVPKFIAAALALATSLATHAAGATFSYGKVDVDGVEVFYREAGNPQHRTLVLLHGFPSSSQMYAGLMEDLADRYHVIAPDYPGSGHTVVKDGARFVPTFDGVTDVMERFLQKKGLDRFALYLQDFGGPVGMRLAVRHPEWVSALILQNANAYEEGLSTKLRDNIAFMKAGVNPTTQRAFDGVLSAPSVAFMYTAGTKHPERQNPDSQALANAGLASTFYRQVQMNLLADYHTNVALYPEWQRYLREQRPATLVVWGRNDPLFTAAGAEAVKRDVPKAEVHLLDTGHFALEEERAAIGTRVADFLGRLKP